MLNTLSNMELEIDSLQNHIDIYWDEYELAEVKHYIIIRKKYSIPTNIKDGSLIYDGLETDCSDTNVKNGELYYYRLFICLDEDIYTNNVVSDSRCVAKAIGFTTETDYGELLYNTFPEQVRYDDKRLDKDYPLKRMMKLIAFPFNRLNTYVDAMLEQLDVDTCDEKYLPYLAKWNGLEYNENLTADLNRLLIKTWNEAEPYIGTEQGIKYFLQRIFKAEVEVDIENGVSLEIHLTLNSDNAWLFEQIDYIKKMVRQYCALSINYSFTTSIIDIESRKNVANDSLIDTLLFNDEETFISDKNDDYLKDDILYMYDEVKDKPIDVLSMVCQTNDPVCLTNDTLYTNTNYIKDFVDKIYVTDDEEYIATHSDSIVDYQVEICQTNDPACLTNDTLYTNEYTRYPIS